MGICLGDLQRLPDPGPLQSGNGSGDLCGEEHVVRRCRGEVAGREAGPRGSYLLRAWCFLAGEGLA